MRDRLVDAGGCPNPPQAGFRSQLSTRKTLFTIATVLLVLWLLVVAVIVVLLRIISGRTVIQ